MKHLLKAIGLAKSTYYFEMQKEDPIKTRNKEVTDEIKDIFEHHKGRYGVRRVYMELVNRGYKINHKRVQRIMHEAGLEGKRPKEKYHSYRGKVGKVADNLINRDFNTSKPLQKWTTDISQFSFPWGKCYLSPILDMHTNEIIAYDLAQSPNMAQIHRMLDRAFAKFPSFTGLIMHSDQGWQYQMYDYQRRLKEKGIRQSMSRKGNCLDNSVMENFFGLLKSELLYLQEFESVEHFKKELIEYLSWYNEKRIKVKLKGLTPLQFRNQSLKSA